MVLYVGKVNGLFAYIKRINRILNVKEITIKEISGDRTRQMLIRRV